MMFLKRDLPVWLGFLGGMTVALETFLNIDIIKTGSRVFLQWRVIIAAAALVLGGGNMVRIHLRKLSARKENWQYSVILLASLFILCAIGLTQGTKAPAYAFLFNNMYSPLGATVFSMNAFWLCSACYRAFRARNSMAIVLLVSGILVILGSVGVGAAMWNQLPVIGNWIMTFPNSAAMRGMNMGAALGMVGVSLRVMVGLERGHLGAQ